MGRRQALTEKGVHRLPRKARRYTLPDIPPDPKRPISYLAVARRPKGQQIWRVVGQSHYMALRAL
jgi:hypothetical protein